MTQNAKLLRYLEQHGSITTAEATDNLRIFRVSERIRELEALGWRFDHLPHTTEGGARVIRYKLVSAPQPSTASWPRAALSKESVGQREVAVAEPAPCYSRSGKLLCYCE